MRLSGTLSWYLARQFGSGIGFVLLVMAGVVFFADLIELLRRSADKSDMSFGITLEMALLHLPTLTEKLLPFAALFGGIWTFSRLTRSHELVVARAAGVSAWQFLAPALLIAVALGVFMVALFNPLSAVMVSRFERLEAVHLKGRPSLLAFSDSGIWLRQADADGQSVVHALRVSSEGTDLSDVTIFLYRSGDQFVGRIDAASARLRAGYWELTDALLTGPDQQAQRHETYEVPTTLTAAQIQDSFASPETLSFWSLPGFIEALEAAGFSATRHRLHWHALLATPLLLCAMVLLGASFSLRLTRRGYTGLLVVAGVLFGFALYFVSDLVLALGLAGNLPAVLAAWAPAGVTALMALAMMFHLEDG